VQIGLPELRESHWLGFGISLLASSVLTPLVCRWAIKLNLLARKDESRHIHKNPVPRIGGVAIYISLLVTSLLLLAVYGRYSIPGTRDFELVGTLVGGTLIFITGLLDDISPLPAWLKLLAQIFASVVAWLCGVQVKFVANPLFFLGLAEGRTVELGLILSFVVTICWLILITNALNLIDGLDGVAGGVALIMSLCLWAILIDPKISQPSGALLAASLGGSIIGFLRLNYNPARIFLGDCGAYFLGFTLGATAVAGLSDNPNTSVVGCMILIAFSFPLADVFWAVLRRILKRKSIMQPDDEHIHHRILKAGLSTKATMFLIYGTCLLLGLVACTLSGSHKRYLVLALLVASLAILSIFLRRR